MLIARQAVVENGRFYFSRIPVYGEDLDDIKRFMLKNEILQAAQESPEKLLKEFVGRSSWCPVIRPWMNFSS